MTGPSARDVALDVLVRVEDGAFANVALPAVLRGTALDGRARAQVTDWVYGTLRRRRSLDHLLTLALDRPLARLEPPVRAGLRLGAYQLVEGTAAHAAVGETVTAVARRTPRARGFVNAVLRTVAGMGPHWPWPGGDDVTSFAVRASVPDWMVARLERDLGRDDARVLLAAANDPGVLTLRPNPQRTTVDDLAVELARPGAHVERGPLVPSALLVRGAGDPAALACVREGRATPQDQASQAVAALVGAMPGERVLEVGAAPGGKATALAESMGDEGSVVALDAHPGRTGLVMRAARRLGLRAVTAVVADGRALPVPRGGFDRVLLDAPCSGLGVLRRRPEARWRIEEGAVEELACLQRELLLAAADAVRPGGRLVYSVCTLTAAETVAIDEWLAVVRTDLVAEPVPGAPWSAVGRAARLLPQAARTDGMYVLILRRAE